ncbi:MAG TPA: MarR family transcriptional regulator [Bacteroidales bacterium]
MNTIAQRSVIYKVGITGALIKSFFKRKLFEAGIDITPEQFILLRELSKRGEPRTIQQLSQATLKDAASVSRTLDILIKKKWITRTIAKEDKRFRYIELTDGGKEILDKSVPVVIEINSDIVKNLDENEIEQISSALRKMHENLEMR